MEDNGHAGELLDRYREVRESGLCNGFRPRHGTPYYSG